MTLMRWVGGLVLAGVCVSALGADVSPESEYQKRLKMARAVEPLGDRPFGESVNLMTGELAFSVTDVQAEGQGPLIQLTRTSLKNDRMRGFDPAMLGNWDLSIPRIETLIPAANRFESADPGAPGALWTVNKGSLARCTQFDWLGSEVWWNGYEFVDGSGSRQQLLKRDVQNTAQPSMLNPQGGVISFPVVTQSNWQIGCLPNTSNGEVGEAFLAVSPDGTKYYLDHLVGVRADTVAEILPDPGDPLLASAGVTTMAGPIRLWYPRMFATMYVSKIEDRFGNTLTFTYNGRQIASIAASDGRRINFVWRSDAPLIDQIIVQPGASQRIWRYEYANIVNIASSGWQANLSAVVQPDGSRWSYSGALPEGQLYNPNGCTLRSGLADGTSVSSFTATHPSGLTGIFATKLKWHSRSYVPSLCDTYSGTVPAETHPLLLSTATLISKTLSGPGIQTGTWNYQYSTAVGSAARDACAANQTCADSRWVEVVNPDSTRTRYTVSNRWGVLEGKALKQEYLDAAANVIRTDTTTYADPAGGPYPSRLGAILGAPYGTNVDSLERLAPVATTTTQQQGATFSNAVTARDQFGKPTALTRSSSLGYSRSDVVQYENSLPKWIIGQQTKVTCVSPAAAAPAGCGLAGTVVSETVFDALLRPVREYEFGRLQATYSYHADGSIATIQDGNNNVTVFSDWKRGIPQTVQFADGSTQLTTVSDLGEVKDAINEAGSKTCYGYDVMGRLSSVTYPSQNTATACNTDKWAQTLQSFSQVAVAEYGIPAGHWRQSVSTGAGQKITYFDAMWRPVLVKELDASNGTTEASTKRFQRFAYDQQGRQTFVSYLGATDALTTGIWNEYDILNRVTSSSQDSDGPQLVTLTEYLSGFKTRVTNPKGQVSTTSFEAYDQPNTELPSLIVEPGDVQTSFIRNSFGKVLAITRAQASSGVWQRRYLTYNDYQELCKSTDTESQTTAYGYDGAGNLVWSATGLAWSPPAPCEHTAEGVASKRVDRSYDQRNRLKTLHFPDGRGDQVWSYTPDGLPLTITTSAVPNDTAPVVNVYGYNSRRLITGETSGQTGWYTWGIGYGYNANGHLFNVNHADGFSIVYAPNALGQASQAGSYATGVQYYPNGAIKQFTYGNGLVHTMAQNARQLPAVSVDCKISGASCALADRLLHLSYGYDAVGNVASITDGVNGLQTRSMSYDNLNRLSSTSGVGFGNASYTYDGLDNLKSVKVTGGPQPRDQQYNYNASFMLTSVTNTVGEQTVIGLSYDSQGNLKNKNGQIYDFDYGNRLRAVTGKETYKYDGFGRRVQSWGSTYSVWMYSLGGQLTFSHDARNNRATNYIYLGNSLLAVRERPMNGSTYSVRYFHNDALGSALAESNELGALSQTNAYEPFGQPADHIGITDGPGFTGHVQDAATGMSYMQQRYYDPLIGRFLSIDPVAASPVNGSNFNRYAYVGNNPFSFTDPDGRYRCRMGPTQCDWIEEALRRARERLKRIKKNSPLYKRLSQLLDQLGDPNTGDLEIYDVRLNEGTLGQNRERDRLEVDMQQLLTSSAKFAKRNGLKSADVARDFVIGSTILHETSHNDDRRNLLGAASTYFPSTKSLFMQTEIRAYGLEAYYRAINGLVRPGATVPELTREIVESANRSYETGCKETPNAPACR